MSSEFDRKHLIDIFVMEASDGMNVLTEALGSSADSIPAPWSLVEQFIVAHRIRGAAALYGYRGIARLAERLETLLEQAPSTPPGQWPQTVGHMRGLTQTIQLLVRSIGQGEREDEGVVDRCLASMPESGHSHQEEALFGLEYLVPELDNEVLAYFQPEAEGYLDTIDELIQILRQNRNDPDAIDRLFRATHTLKGSAYTVEFQIIGDVAHPMEDCLIAIREQRLSINDDLLDAMSKASGIIRRILQRDPAHIEQLQSSVPHVMHVLRHMCGGQDQDPSTTTSRTIVTSKDSLPVLSRPEVSGSPSQIAPVDRYLFPNLDAEVQSYFVPEAQEYLETLEADLLRLENDPRNRELINQLFRTAHTLKGSAYTIGYRAIGDLIHHLEDFMGAVREERLIVLPGHTDVMLRSVDIARALIRGDQGSAALTKQRFEAVQSELKQLAQSSNPDALKPSPSEQALDAQNSLPTSTKESQGQAPGTSGTESREVVRVSHARIERLMNLVGELVIGRGRLEQRLRVLEQLSRQVLVFKTRLGDSIQTFADKHMFTYQEIPSHHPQPAIQGMSGLGDFGNLELDKYDDFNILARRIGEITDDINESMAQLDGSIQSAHDDMSQLQQLTLLMRDEIARARMVPIGTPFTRFRRTIRETAHALNKDVSLVTSGEQTEVDTGVVERLVDPLVHLVRNAVYHGIEPSAERIAKGKPAVGTIYLHATHRGNSVIIEIEDDGAGMDLDKIRAQAVKMGLVRSDQMAQMSDAQTLQLIFLPGFSTAEKVGDQAGRGVGLDVVKQAIASMNGHIDVESELGAGTKFTLHIPLTLLIATALLVRAGTERYAIPLPSIVEVTIPTLSSLRQQNDQTFLEFDNQSVPVYSLRHLLSREQVPIEGMMPVVIVRMATGPIGLAVDELLGRQEIVIKSLGVLKPFEQSSFGGATIDTEGRVVLVIDPSRLFSREPKISVSMTASSRRDRHSQDIPPLDPTVEGPHDVRLLLVDDSLSIRKFVGKMLESAGYRVDTAVDGEDGFRKASTTRYSLIITDLEMPKLNGFEVVQALRSRPDTKETPVLVMTTRAGEKHHHMAMNIGATAYITKPVEERILLKEIERWIGSSRRP